jgi:hypothetical protein
MRQQVLDGSRRNSSRVQAAKSAVAEGSHMIFIVTAPRRSSTSMPRSATDCIGAAGNAKGTNSCEDTVPAAPAWRASLRHPCTTLVLMPRDMATLATDAPGVSHSPSTWALKSGL